MNRLDRLKNLKRVHPEINADETIKIVRGINGQDGEQGIPGEKGMDGEKGETGLPGTPGIKGEKGERGLKGDKGDPGLMGKNGKPGLVWRGTWEENTKYLINDVVENMGSSFVCIKAHTAALTNIPQLNTHLDYWELAAKRGEQGAAGSPGATGLQGVAGQGLIIGGTTGQLLAKNSNTDFDTKWEDAPSGLPSQTGKSGDYLTTDGSSASWAAVAAGGQTAWDAIVATSGGDYTSVTAAITGGAKRIFVRSGTYTEAGIPSGSPNTTAGITIVGDNPETAILSFGVNDCYLSGVDVTIANLKLSYSTGMLYLGGNYSSMDTVHFASSDATNVALNTQGIGAVINNLTFFDTASVGTVAYRFQISGASSNITNCYFKTTRNGQNALVEIDGNHTTVSNCYFYNGGAQGGSSLIRFAAVGQSITGCTFENVGGSDGGIRADGSLGMSITGNTGDGGQPFINLTSSSAHSCVAGNSFYCPAAGGTAIQVSSGPNTITGNLIYHRSTSGGTAKAIVIAASVSNNVVTGNCAENALVGLTINSGASATVVSGNDFANNGTAIIDSGTNTVYNNIVTPGKTFAVSNSLTLAGTDGTTMTFPSTSATIARTDAANTFTGTQSATSFNETNVAVTVTSNAGTCAVANGLNTFTNSSAATMAITLATVGAVDGQLMIVRVYDFSAVAQTIGWTNTENSTVTLPTVSNGSTTLPLTCGFQYNAGTSKWRAIGAA